VAGVGTGGTITGVGRRLKEANTECRVVAVEPRLGVHVQGLKSLADGWIPPILDESVLDGRIIVGNRHAVSHSKRVMLAEGLFVGVSSGAVMHAGLRVASRLGGGNIVLMFADGGSKYVGTELWAATDGEDNAEPEDPLDDVLWW
jgi:cysteine synthase B